MPLEPSLLRFAVLCEDSHLEAWQARCLALLEQQNCARLVLVIIKTPSGRPQCRLWGRYQRYVATKALALKRVAYPAHFASAPHIACEVSAAGRGLEHVRDQDIATIRSHRLDFVLQFGSGILQGEVLAAARYGVWAYDHDLERTGGGAPACFWDVLRHAPTTRTTLRQRVAAPDSDLVLSTATFATGRSFPATFDAVAFGSAECCTRACRVIQLGDEPTRQEPAPKPACAAAIPDNRQILTFLCKQIAGYFGAKWAKQFYLEEWNVGLVAESVDRLLERGRLAEVKWLGTGSERTFLADPMVLTDSGHFLAEHFDYDGGAKGSIVRCEPGADGGLTVSPFLEADHHLSYPFVLRHDDRTYIIPEAHEAGVVSMYALKADGTLGPPELLMARSVADPTLVHTGGRWWLFCSEGSLKLLAFYAETLRGPWQPHRLNPLKIDVTSSRPAGPLFERDGSLLRPAQDCSETYGGAIVVHRIVDLTPERFHEEIVARIGPEPDGSYPTGVHTLNVLNGCCLVDGKRTVFDPTWVLRGRAHGRKVRARRARLAIAMTALASAG